MSILQNLINDPNVRPEIKDEATQAGMDILMESIGYKRGDAKGAGKGGLRKALEAFVGQEPPAYEGAVQRLVGGGGPSGQAGAGRGNAKTMVGGLPPGKPGQPGPIQVAAPAGPPVGPQAQPQAGGGPRPLRYTPEELQAQRLGEQDQLLQLQARYQKDIEDHRGIIQQQVDEARIKAEAAARPEDWKQMVVPDPASPTGYSTEFRDMTSGKVQRFPHVLDSKTQAELDVLIKAGKTPQEASKMMADQITLQQDFVKSQTSYYNSLASQARSNAQKLQMGMTNEDKVQAAINLMRIIGQMAGDSISLELDPTAPQEAQDALVRQTYQRFLSPFGLSLDQVREVLQMATEGGGTR